MTFASKALIAGLLLASRLPAVQAGDLIANNIAMHKLDHGQERVLVNALEDVGRGELDGALVQMRQIVTRNPKFRLAQLVYGDLLLAKSRPIHDFGSMPSASYARITALREEARARLQHYLEPPPPGTVPSVLVKMSSAQQYAVVVNMSTSRLYLFENRHGIPQLLLDYYATIGKKGMGKGAAGDQKTPVGVYFVTGYIGRNQLPDFYGDGAFPIDYPNAWDERHGRTGYGIWLHGTPHDTYSRPPRDSDGCVILSNADLDDLGRYIKPGQTPVILTDGVTWLSPEEWQNRQARLETVVDQWRRDWESRNTDLYLRHYSKSYTGLGKDYKQWVDYKRRVNAGKKFIKVELSDQSMFLYPGEDDVMVVTFEQDYRSDDLHRVFVKRQYWRKDADGKWRIVYEGSVS